MKKILILHCLFVLFISCADSQMIHRYEYSAKSELYESVEIFDYKRNEKNALSKLKTWMEKDLDARINYSLTVVRDEKGNERNILVLDIRKKEVDNWLFETTGHKSLLISSAALHFLQPENFSWSIHTMILKVNGIFCDELPTEIHYYAVWTRYHLWSNMYYKPSEK